MLYLQTQVTLRRNHGDARMFDLQQQGTLLEIVEHAWTFYIQDKPPSISFSSGDGSLSESLKALIETINVYV